MLFTSDARFDFDQHAINHLTVAIRREMSPAGADRHPLGDTLFMGGLPPSDADARALALFGQQKNYKIVYPSFDAADPGAGPTGFHAVVTDGVTDPILLSHGRLWKADRRSAAVLLFPGLGGVVKLSAKGRMLVRPMRAGYAEEGYALAREGVLARAALKPGGMPVVSPMGGMPTVLDMNSMLEMMKAGVR